MSSSPAPSHTADTETDDPGYRSRSQSRRSRRRKQAQKQQPAQKPPTIQEEAPQSSQQSQQQQPQNTMQPFERIGPAETSMDGPVTYARAQRGEIPMRVGDQGQQLATGKQGGGEKSEMMDKEGLKLRLELNLDIEIELKASIRGDVTLALL